MYKIFFILCNILKVKKVSAVSHHLGNPPRDEIKHNSLTNNQFINDKELFEF